MNGNTYLQILESKNNMLNTEKSNDTTSRGSQLCLTCGICCQGIFLYHDEDPQKYGIDFEQMKLGERNPFLSLTCSLYHDDKCIIHDDPQFPACCREFRCQLLQRLLMGDINLEEGKLIVKKIKTLIDKIIPQLPELGSPRTALYLMSNTLNSIRQELSAGDQTHIALFLDIFSLHRLVHHYIVQIK